MPMYRYVCENCGSEKVVMHPMNESPLITCDKCGSAMKRSIGRVGVIFKGSGFYITDSKKSNSNNGKSGSDKEKNETKSSETAKTKT